jgi:putative transposase
LCRTETERLEGGSWHVGWQIGKFFFLDGRPDRLARRVQDILITCTDNLNGFTDAIRTVFPKSSTQICVVHQIRNPCKYVVYKERVYG